jgi:hypothetical protein
VENGVTNLVAIHVDDMVAAASTRDANELFKTQLRSKWDISDLGNIQFCLGIGIVRDPERCTITLSQTALIDRLVMQFHQTDAHPAATPMETGLRLHRPSSDIPALSQLDVDRLAQNSVPFPRMQHDVCCCRHSPGHLAGFLDCYNFDHWRTAVSRQHSIEGLQRFRFCERPGEEEVCDGLYFLRSVQVRSRGHHRGKRW